MMRWFLKPAPAAKTHDRTRRAWGFDHGITSVADGGKTIRAYGWGGDHEQGDFLILPHPQARFAGETSRYQVRELERCSNPPDMWFATLEFAPR